MRKAFYIDSYCSEHFHEMFNASSLQMFSFLYDEIDYYGQKESLHNIKLLLKEMPDNVRVHSHCVLNNKSSRMRNVIKKIWSALLNLYYIIRAPHQTDVIINYNTVIALYPINWLVRLLKKRVLIVCHSEMQDILELRPTSFLFKKSIRFFKRGNVKVAKTLWFSVLGEAIRKNVLAIVSPQIAEKLLSFDHTAVFNYNDSIQNVQDKKTLKLGYIGGFRDSKGAKMFMELSKFFQDDNKIEFRFIGNVQGNQKKLESSGVVLPQGIGSFFIQREDMYRHIKQLDYVLFCFPPDGYKFTASGSLFDAIDNEIPILSLRNDFFEGMFHEYGNFGYLEDDVEGLKRRILWLKQHKNESKWDVRSVKEKVSPESAAQRFSKSKWFES